MYAASLKRFVLAIECFPPNIERLKKAAQREKAQNNIVLVSNAIYTESGMYCKLTKEPSNIGGQGLGLSRKLNKTDNDIHRVRTIKFDEILPILKQRKVRKALLKIDIETSESFVFQSGHEVFHSIDIPFIMMEWAHVKKDPAG